MINAGSRAAALVVCLKVVVVVETSIKQNKTKFYHPPPHTYCACSLPARIGLVYEGHNVLCPRLSG